MQAKNVASSEITICGRTYDEYIEMIKAFHGHVAQGVVLGGFMVVWLIETFHRGIILTPYVKPGLVFRMPFRF